jgi:chaperonin GroES
MQFKTVKPVGDRVLVKVDKEESKTVGGVLLPAVAQNKPTTGSIVAVGEAETVQVGGQQGCIMPVSG